MSYTVQPNDSKNRRTCFLITVLVAAFFSMSTVGMADYKQAVIYYTRGQCDKVIQEVKPDLEADPKWELGHRLLGLCYKKTKKYDLAVAELTRAIELKSPAFSTYMGLGEIYWEQNKFDKTAEILGVGEKYLKPSDEEQVKDIRYRLYHLRGSAHYRQKKYADAVRDLTQALRLNSNDAADFSQLGISYYHLGKYEDAIAALGKATSIKAGDRTSTEFLARCYQKRGETSLKNKQYKQAVEDLNKALGFNSTDGSIHYNLGLAYLLMNNYDAAESALMKAAELLPNNADTFQQLGYIYEKKKQYNKALDAYKKAYGLKKDPQVKAGIERVTQAMEAPK
jgi:tetratricopeptide (TPR) repeat protein